MKKNSAEQVKLWRLPDEGGVELVRASFFNQRFGRHVHENYGFGVIEDGALGFRYQGENLVAARGMISLVVPGEAHDGHPADVAGWAYRMFYLDASVMERAASSMADRPFEAPYFSRGVVRDPALARHILAAHQRLENPQAPLLERQSLLLFLVSRFILRHASPGPALKKTGREHGAVQKAREFMEAHYGADISLVELSDAAAMSRFHFIRVFKSHTGLPPHAFLMGVRLRRAREKIAKGLSLAQTAQDCGFADQSHLTRHFKRTYGLTPGKFRNCVL